jgi:hypothetical protein
VLKIIIVSNFLQKYEKFGGFGYGIFSRRSSIKFIIAGSFIKCCLSPDKGNISHHLNWKMKDTSLNFKKFLNLTGKNKAL